MCIQRQPCRNAFTDARRSSLYAPEETSCRRRLSSALDLADNPKACQRTARSDVWQMEGCLPTSRHPAVLRDTTANIDCRPAALRSGKRSDSIQESRDGRSPTSFAHKPTIHRGDGAVVGPAAGGTMMAVKRWLTPRRPNSVD